MQIPGVRVTFVQKPKKIIKKAVAILVDKITLFRTKDRNRSFTTFQGGLKE